MLPAAPREAVAVPPRGARRPPSGEPEPNGNKITACERRHTASGSCAALRLCDDFESAAAGGPPGATWTTATPNRCGPGTLAVDATEAHSGARSVKISGGGYCNHVFLATSKARFGDALSDGHVTYCADSAGTRLTATP
jgi:hypothetical protein